MASASTPNSRASLLAGLRTGGVRSTSQPHQVPHTAAPTGSFNIHRFASSSHPSNPFPEEDEEDDGDQLANMAAHGLSLNGNNFNSRQGIPMTAGAADGAVNNYQQQQQQLILRQLAAQRAAMGGGVPYPTNGDQAEMQAQMMQMELLKYQAFHQAQQAQQYQAELLAQAQRQQQQQQQQQPVRGSLRRPSLEPMTAGPGVTSFDHRANVAAQLRARAQQAEHRSALAAADDLGPVPMTAAIGGKFASRMLNPQANSFVASRFGGDQDDESTFVPGNAISTATAPVPSTPGRTTVISGGTSLGTPIATAFNIPAPSKSDAAVSWRRGSSTNNSMLRSASATPPLNTKVNRVSPPNEEISPSVKSRPQPLRFNAVVSSPFPAVSIDTGVEEEVSSNSSKDDSHTSTSTPSTPPSAHSSLSGEPKKPYDGLGMGRPAPNSIAAATPTRHASLPSRQPKGPPSGADELGPRNFATRLRRKALGGLNTLVAVRERRDLAIEIQAY